ncbi:hypothetical protein H0H81_004921 [Sphagnurus paluster]|uniref:Protein-S-isoprenylcysteine O-methyltransferase n=1 Tax=Sphagnurus paluster TaxID=117069 RepID=A0A9P7FXV2_9AGAR|nr:hypothetical protein H0H81_004921 [Sphagnurus paluster]
MDSETSERIEETLKQRVEEIEKSQAQSAPQQHPLLTIPVATQAPHGNIPNTPLASSTVAFLLGGLFFLGFVTFALGGFTTYWWTTAQLGFFVAAWAGFHWGEFAVTAGWNLEKCSVDSYLLDNGAMYHVANGAALTEYLISLYFWPHLKTNRYVTATGIALVMFGQLLRSAAMIHASTNFSHAVAYSKRKTHTLVTDGVYAGRKVFD